MAIKVNPYEDVSDDHVRCEVSYTLDQDYPSPKLVADYERDEERGISDASFYLNHGSRPPCVGPCPTGERVRAYAKRRDEAHWIFEMGDAFGEMACTPVEELPSSLNKESIISTSRIFNTCFAQSK